MFVLFEVSCFVSFEVCNHVWGCLGGGFAINATKTTPKKKYPKQLYLRCCVDVGGLGLLGCLGVSLC